MATVTRLVKLHASGRGHKSLIPGSPTSFQTWYFNASTIFQPGLRVGGGRGGGIVHTMVQQVRLFGRGSTIPPTALDDTKGRWRSWHRCYLSGDCEDGRPVGVCHCVLMCTAALQQSGAVLSSPIAEAAGSFETWLRVACQYTIIFSSWVSWKKASIAQFITK